MITLAQIQQMTADELLRIAAQLQDEAGDRESGFPLLTQLALSAALEASGKSFSELVGTFEMSQGNPFIQHVMGEVQWLAELTDAGPELNTIAGREAIYERMQYGAGLFIAAGLWLQMTVGAATVWDFQNANEAREVFERLGLTEPLPDAETPPADDPAEGV